MVWNWVGLWVWAVHQSMRETMLQTYTALAGLCRRQQGHLQCHKGRSTVLFFPRAIIQWFLCSKIIGGDNLPALLISTVTSSHPPYLHSSQKTLSPLLHWDKFTGCPADKIYAFLAYCHWCLVQGFPENSFEKVQEYELGVRDEQCHMNDFG